MSEASPTRPPVLVPFAKRAGRAAVPADPELIDLVDSSPESPPRKRVVKYKIRPEALAEAVARAEAELRDDKKKFKVDKTYKVEPSSSSDSDGEVHGHHIEKAHRREIYQVS